MKKYTEIFLIALSVVSGLFITAAEPEAFIPEQATTIMRFSAQKVLKNPFFQKRLQFNEKHGKKLLAALGELKNTYGIEPAMLFAGEVWYAKTGMTKTAYGVYAKTALAEEKLAALLAEKLRDDKHVKYSTEVLGEKKLYVLTPTDRGVRENPPVAICYLAEDVIMLMPLASEAAGMIAASVQGTGNLLVKQIDRKAVGALYSKIPGEKNKITSADAQFDLQGKSQSDIVLNVCLTCKDPVTAMQMAMQIQFIAPGFIGMLLSNDQELAASIISQFIVKPDGDRIRLEFELDKSTQDKIVEYLSNPANRAKLPINNSVGPGMPDQQ